MAEADAIGEDPLMQSSDLRHRLVAIMEADGVGYSRLMSVDERATVIALDAAREVFRTQIHARGGRVIDMAGDSVLAVFETAAGAVNAGLDVQRQLAAAMADAQPDRCLRFRIGVHLGDVFEKSDGTVYGDGVNVAARLEGLAEPGGVAVSQSVQTAVQGRVSARFEDMGEQSVKNIAQPVRVFRLHTGAGSAADVSAAVTVVRPARRMRWLAAVATGLLAVVVGAVAVRSVWRSTFSMAPAEAMTDARRLSIVALPFANLTGDPGQDYFAEGLTAALTSDLSRIEGVFVIDSATAQSYKGRAQTAQQIGQALAVRFVLQGNVQRSGSQFRINALLADASTNKQLWSDRFEGDTSDLFALQDQVTGRIANTMGRELRVVAASESEKRRDAPQVADLMLRAAALSDKPHSMEKWQGVEQFYRQALAIDTKNMTAMALLSGALAFKTRFVGDAAERGKVWAEALDLAGKATAVDPNLSEPYRVRALHDLRTGDLESARIAAEAFMRLKPRTPDPFNVMGNVYQGLNEPAKALEMYKQAVALSPKETPAVFAANLAAVYFWVGDYQAAIEWNLRALQTQPEFWRAHVGLAQAYAMVGDDAKARAEAQTVRKFRPGFRVDVGVLRAEAASAVPSRRALIEEKLIPASVKSGLTQ
jgi:adenylate cyclase